jgi:diguanylate cyclase (GGDEF)-like protein
MQAGTIFTRVGICRDMRSSGSAIRTEIQIEQARSLIGGLPATLTISLAIMISLACVLWTDQRSDWVPIWLAASILVNALRWRDYRRMRALDLDGSNVGRVLRRLVGNAFAAGLLWSFVPLVRIGEVETPATAFTLFILAGTSAGALIQSLPCARVGLVFFLPALLSAAVALFSRGTLDGGIVGIDVLLLAFMMTRQATRSQATFVSNQELRLDAVRLAESLAEANRLAVAANVRLSHIARHDVLTTLYNRAALNEELETRIAAARERRETLALAIVDLDDFKMINDTQGHAAGDVLLTEVAGRLAGLCRPVDFVARLGGDEFAVLVAEPDAHGFAPALADAVIEAMNVPITIAGRQSVVGLSIGLALYPQHAGSPVELLASADIALYEAKRQGKRRVALYDSALRRDLEDRRRIESEIADALAEDRLGFHFQPQIDLATGRIIGHEGLVRWAHPVLGDVPPPEIVAAAQNAHVGDRLTDFAVRRACRLVGELQRLGDRTSTVAINVSPVEFRSSSPADIVLRAIAEHGADPRRIEIEITEEAILDFAVAAADLARLGAAGVRLAIDDFGAGHFSLASLSNLRLDRIKIDRSFIAGIDTNPRNRLVTGKILALARELGIVALGEGVEREAEAETLRRLGCSEAQGWLYGRARPIEEVLEQVRAGLAAASRDTSTLPAAAVPAMLGAT